MDCSKRVLTGTGEIFSLRLASRRKGSGVGVIGLLSQAVATDVLDGQKANLVTQALGHSGPVVGAAAGLHQDGGRRLAGQELAELAAGQTLSLADAAGLPRHGNLENRLCQIHRDGRRINHGLLLSRAAMNSIHVGTMMPFTWKEESISSVQRTRVARFARSGSPLTRRPLGRRSPAMIAERREGVVTAFDKRPFS